MNTAIFSYPDVLTNDRYFALDKRCDKLHATIAEKVSLLEEAIQTEGRIPKDILLPLRSQGFYGLGASVEHGGEGLTVTETVRLLEELASVDLSLSETVAVPATLGYRAIELYGTEDQVGYWLSAVVNSKVLLFENFAKLEIRVEANNVIFINGV